MKRQSFLDTIRDLLGREEIEQALEHLRGLLDGSPALYEVLQQSGRFAAISRQVRLGTVSHVEATLTKNQLHLGVLELLHEIEGQTVQGDPKDELERYARTTKITQQADNIYNIGKIDNANFKIDETNFYQITKGEYKSQHILTLPSFFPDIFLGREDDLTRIHNRLFVASGNILLLTGEGGLGKTSLAARYFELYKSKYAHVAWVTSNRNLADALLTLATPLGLTEDESFLQLDIPQRIEKLLTAMSNLPQPCLLVIDNANELEDIKTYYPKLQRCSNFRIMFTTRINEYGTAAFLGIAPLPEHLALRMFRTNYKAFATAEEPHFRKLYKAVGGNTLILEVFAKNLSKLNNGLKKRYPLKELVGDVVKGLLLPGQNAAVEVRYQLLQEATPEEIIGAMYKISDLNPKEAALLAVFAALPPEQIAFDDLEALQQQQDQDSLLLSLAQRGWLYYAQEARAFRCSPVVQAVVRRQHSNWKADCRILVQGLVQVLHREKFHKNNFSRTALYARYAETATMQLDAPYPELVKLCQNLGSFHSVTGDLSKALQAYIQMEQLLVALLECNPVNADFKNGLAISYGELGSTHTALGNLPTALTFFEEYNRIEKELHSAYPENVSFKNSLAISYGKLGETHTALGNLPTALTFFEECNKLKKELNTAYPENVSFKNGLAISYEKLGYTHTALGNLPIALTFFEEYNRLEKELYAAYPEIVDFKNSLAISYGKLGETHTALGNLPTALIFFENVTELFKELHAAYPKNVSFNNSLAISYGKLGETHTALGNLLTALTFFEDETELFKELHAAYPENVSFKNGLAVSHSKVGSTHTALGNLPTALTFFEKDFELSIELHAAYPENVSFKSSLAISYEKLGYMHTTLGNLPTALTFFEEYNRLEKELHDAYPEIVDFKNGLAISYERLGSTHTALGNLPMALTFFEDETELFKELHAAYPENVSFKNGLAISYGKLAWFYQCKINESDKAITYFQKCYDIWKELSDQYSDYQEFRKNYECAKKALGL